MAAGYVVNSDTLSWSFNTTGVTAVSTGPPANTIVIQIAETFSGDEVLPIVQPSAASADGEYYLHQARLSGSDLIYVQFGDALGSGGAPNHIDPTIEDLDFFYILVGHIT